MKNLINKYHLFLESKQNCFCEVKDSTIMVDKEKLNSLLKDVSFMELKSEYTRGKFINEIVLNYKELTDDIKDNVKNVLNPLKNVSEFENYFIFDKLNRIILRFSDSHPMKFK